MGRTERKVEKSLEKGRRIGGRGVSGLPCLNRWCYRGDGLMGAIQADWSDVDNIIERDRMEAATKVGRPAQQKGKGSAKRDEVDEVTGEVDMDVESEPIIEKTMGIHDLGEEIL